MKDQIIAYCGIDCSKCDAYIGTKNNDQDLLTKTAAYWSKLNGVTITPEQLHCEGCRMDGIKTVFCSSLCAIRLCATSKKCETCGDCSKMNTCEKLGMITSHRKDALNNLKK